jgi:hypothetical protein
MHVAYHSRYMNLQQDLGLTGLSERRFVRALCSISQS